MLNIKEQCSKKKKCLIFNGEDPDDLEREISVKWWEWTATNSGAKQRNGDKCYLLGKFSAINELEK